MISDDNGRWKIIESKAKVNVTGGNYVKFFFVLQRIDEIFFAHVIIPGYSLILLTSSILWMKHGSFLRSLLCGVSIYLHFSLMDRVWWQLPNNGSEVPRIVRYMTMMLLLTATVFIETIFIKIMTDPQRPQSLWIQNTSKFLENHSFLKYFVASPFDKAQKLTPPEAKVIKLDKNVETESVGEPSNLEEVAPAEEIVDKEISDWTTFVRLIDRIFFVTLCSCYTFYNGN